MGVYAIILSMILYMIICADNFLKKDYPHSLIWFAYCLSQLGFLWYELQKNSPNE
jgi:hypothetical protein